MILCFLDKSGSIRFVSMIFVLQINFRPFYLNVYISSRKIENICLNVFVFWKLILNQYNSFNDFMSSKIIEDFYFNDFVLSKLFLKLNLSQ